MTDHISTMSLDPQEICVLAMAEGEDPNDALVNEIVALREKGRLLSQMSIILFGLALQTEEDAQRINEYIFANEMLELIWSK